MLLNSLLFSLLDWFCAALNFADVSLPNHLAGDFLPLWTDQLQSREVKVDGFYRERCAIKRVDFLACDTMYFIDGAAALALSNARFVKSVEITTAEIPLFTAACHEQSTSNPIAQCVSANTIETKHILAAVDEVRLRLARTLIVAAPHYAHR